MAISMARAKVLCNAGELGLVRASSRQEIGKLSAAELRRAETRARNLRDKWRDQSAGQRRKSQQAAGTRDAGANKNSAEKAELFDEVLARFTAQLGKVDDTPGPMGRARSTRSKRSRTHRASRAEVRGELAETKRVLKSKKGKAKTQAAATPVVKRKVKKKAVKRVPVAVEVENAEEEGEVAAPATPVKKPKRAGKPFGADMTGLEAGRKAQGLRVTKKGQLQAATAAKQERLKTSGIVRIQTNRSAANRRQQGRRDSR
jgi:hypothetical protein